MKNSIYLFLKATWYQIFKKNDSIFKWIHFCKTNNYDGTIYGISINPVILTDFMNDFNNYSKISNEKLVINPQFFDKNTSSGTMTGHYFHQDLYIAQNIFDKKPKRHIDIGSRQDGFVAHVASFRLIEIIDICPQTSNIKNIQFTQADLMTLKPEYLSCSDSISSLHALEHFGLGRYGGPINTDGFSIAFNNIYSMLKENGIFYFSVPIGKQRTEFNAHRVFSINYLLNAINPLYHIEDFSLVDDNGDFYEHLSINEWAPIIQKMNYGCGIFILKKK